MELVALEIVLPAAMARCRGDDQVNSIPEEGEGCGIAIERRADTREVVDVLHRVHTEARKRLDIGVAVMQLVHVLEETLRQKEGMQVTRQEGGAGQARGSRCG